MLLKLEANRGIDIDDVPAIRDAFDHVLDMGYLREAATSLDLCGRLELYFGPPAAV